MKPRQLSMIVMGFLLLSSVVFYACSKFASHSALTSDQKLIENAQDYFNSTILNGKGSSPSGDPISTLKKTPRWQKASVRSFGNGKAVVVPVSFDKPLTFYFDQGQTVMPAAAITKMIIYEDISNQMHCEVSTELPDDSYMEDTNSKRLFTGRIRLEDWYGDFIRTMHFTAGKNDKNYLSTSNVIKSANSKSMESVKTFEEEMDCTITDWYVCSYTVPDDGSGVECDLYDESEDCQPVDPSEGAGGYTDYVDIYSASSGGDGSYGGLSIEVGSEDDDGQFSSNLLCNAQFSFSQKFGQYTTTLTGLQVWYVVVDDPMMSFRVSFPTSCLSIPLKYGNAGKVTSLFVTAWNEAIKAVGQDLENNAITNFKAQAQIKTYVYENLNLVMPGTIWTTGTACSGAVSTSKASYCDL